MSSSAASNSTNPLQKEEDDNNKWELQIKTVGGAANDDFTVSMHPEDSVSRLQEEIRTITGLETSQQRLIYRGKLVSSTQLVKDIVGLYDGHAIHLVRRRDSAPQTEDPNEEEEDTDESTPTTPSAESSSNNSSSIESSLLATLLGVGESQRPHQTPATAASHSRRPPYRLQASDLQRPDPGSLEPVRQGLLTMHTTTAPVRTFYRGQWIDCRDTVNQWLEATVVNITSPEAILGDDVSRTLSDTPTSLCPTTDLAVPVTDLDGRRRLLLEECSTAESEEQYDGIYYRRRTNNRNIQLLHIHYNGWPVRWDEWIRSDSERIRPFRVRTRHDSNGSLLPTIAHPLPNPPSTQFGNGNDRATLVPELHRVVGRVQELLEKAASESNASSASTTTSDNRHLPWQQQEPRSQAQQPRQQELAALAPLLDRLGRTLTEAAPHVAALAEASAVSNNTDEPLGTIEEQNEEESPSTLGGFLSLLSRSDRRHANAAPSVSSSAAGHMDVSAASTTEEVVEQEEVAPPIDPDYSDFQGGFVNTTRSSSGSSSRSSRGNRNNNSNNGEEAAAASLLGAYLAAASLGSGGEDGGLGRLLRERGTGGGGNGGGIDIHIHAVVTTPDGGGGGGVAALTGTSIPIATPTAARRTPPAARGVRMLPPVTQPSSDHDENDDDYDIFSELYAESPEPVNPNRNNNSSTTTSTSSEPRRSSGRSSPRRRGGNSGGVLGRLFRRSAADSE